MSASEQLIGLSRAGDQTHGGEIVLFHTNAKFQRVDLEYFSGQTVFVAELAKPARTILPQDTRGWGWNMVYKGGVVRVGGGGGEKGKRGLWQGSLLFPKIEFSIKADMRGWSFLSEGGP